MKEFYKKLLDRKMRLKSLKQTEEVRARLEELTLSIAEAQSFLIANEPTQLQIGEAIDKAYKEAGHNAYFSNGFRRGVDFGIKYIKSGITEFNELNVTHLEQAILQSVSKSYSLHAVEPDCQAINVYLKRNDDIYLFQLTSSWDVLFCHERTSVSQPFNPSEFVDVLRVYGYNL